MMANVIDPKYEYDAPVYVDFTTQAVDQVPDDDADKWFGKISPALNLSPVWCIGALLPSFSSADNRLEDDLLFDNSFNPVGAASKVRAEPPSHQAAALSDNTAPCNDSVPEENQSVPTKSEPTSPLHTKNEEKVPIKTETAVPVCAEEDARVKTSTVVAASASTMGEDKGGAIKLGEDEDGAVKLGEGEGGAVKLGEDEGGAVKLGGSEGGAVKLGKGEGGVVKLREGEGGAVKLGKRSAVIHTTAEELLEEMAKGKHEGVDAPAAVSKAAKVEAPEKAPKPKRERR